MDIIAETAEGGEEGEEAVNLSEEEIAILVNSRLLDSGLTDDIEAGVVCEDYTDEEI